MLEDYSMNIYSARIRKYQIPSSNIGYWFLQ